jgi:septum formation protein
MRVAGYTAVTRELVLASTSKYRRELLARLGVEFVTAAPAIAEFNLLGAGGPRALVLEQAAAKARSLSNAYPRALIIGSDQVGFLDGQLLTKPGTPERAREQLRAMSGKTHLFYTAVAVLDAATGRIESHCDETVGRVRALADWEIDAYLRLDVPFDCAGSIRVELRGVALLRELKCADPTAIVGLPLIALCELLRRFDYDVMLAVTTR